jgi:Fe2+ transport system protein FeoA
MDLALAQRDTPLRVTAVRTHDAGLDRRLAELGLRPGTEVTVLRRTSGRGAIIAIGDDRLALAHSVLTRISVSPAPAAPA